MGLGKSIVALALHRDVSKKTLIVCPKFLISNWRAEMEKFGTPAGQVDLINYAKLRGEPLDDYDLVIIDEAHYLKNTLSKRSKNLFKSLESNKPSYLLMLTATPCKNDVSEVFNLLNLCALHHNDKVIKRFKGNLFKFKRKFMESYSVNFGRGMSTQFKGFRNKEEYKALYTKYVYRKKLSQVYLPPEVNIKLKAGDFSLDKDIASLINSFDKEHFMTMKATAAKLLTNFTIDFVKDIPHQTVIFTDHVKSAESLAKGLDLPCITGKLDVAQRVEVIEKFKTKKIKHLIATYKCAGVGLSLVNCNYMIFNDLPFVPADLLQAKGRIARVTQSKTCFYYYLGLSNMYFKLFSLLKNKTIVLDQIQ